MSALCEQENMEDCGVLRRMSHFTQDTQQQSCSILKVCIAKGHSATYPLHSLPIVGVAQIGQW
jgi:hypothetical protein